MTLKPSMEVFGVSSPLVISVGRTASTLWPGSSATALWVSVALFVPTLMVPFSSVSLFAAMAMPSASTSFSATAYSNKRFAVPEPLTYAAAFAMPSKSSSSSGVPEPVSTVTAWPKVTRTWTTLPMA